MQTFGCFRSRHSLRTQVEGIDPAMSSTPLSTMPRLSCRLCDRPSAMMDGSLDMARSAVPTVRRGSGDQASGSSPADDILRTHGMRWYASRTAVDLNTIPLMLPFRGQMRRWVEPVQTRASMFISQDQKKKAGVEADYSHSLTGLATAGTRNFGPEPSCTGLGVVRHEHRVADSGVSLLLADPPSVSATHL